MCSFSLRCWGDTPRPVWMRGALGGLEGLGRTVDVLVNGTREADHDGVVSCEAADLLYGAEVAWGGDGEAGLDDVHVHAKELLGDDELLLRFMLAPGLCSPSRSVVSKMSILRVMWCSSRSVSLGAFYCRRGPRPRQSINPCCTENHNWENWVSRRSIATATQ